MSLFTRNRISIGILFFLCGLNFATWATRIPDFKSRLALSEAGLGTILMGLPIGSLISLPLAGWLIAKISSRLISVFAVIMYTLIIPIIGYSSNSYMLFVSLFLFGMAGDILNIAMNTQVVALEKKINKTIMSSFHAIFSIGLLVGAILGGYIIQLGYEAGTHFLIITCINVVSIPLFYPNLLIDDEKLINQNTSSKSYLNLGKYLTILAIIAFCGMLSEGAMADWITLYMKEYLIATSYSTTIGFSSFALAMVIGRFIGDFLSAKWGIQKLLIWNGTLISAGMILILFVPQVEIKIVGCFITGLGISTIVPMIYSQAGAQNTLEPAIAIAGVSTIAYMGFLIGPVAIGYLAEFFNLQNALSLVVLLGALATIVAKKYLK